MKILDWILTLAIAGIYIMTLFFKFSGAEESVYIFTQVAGPDMEAFARISSGVAELITAILILIPKTRIYGAILSVLVIGGAIISHLTILGISVKDDGGQLFVMACAIFVMSISLIAIHRSEIPIIGDKA